MCIGFHLRTKLHFRGFSSHLGYWTGHEDYYDHTAQELYQPVVNISLSLDMASLSIILSFPIKIVSDIMYCNPTHLEGLFDPVILGIGYIYCVFFNLMGGHFSKYKTLWADHYINKGNYFFLAILAHHGYHQSCHKIFKHKAVSISIFITIVPGTQHHTIHAGSPWGLPTSLLTLPHHLASLDYISHHIGKF